MQHFSLNWLQLYSIEIGWRFWAIFAVLVPFLFHLGPWTTSFPITFLAEIGWEFLETFAVFKLFFQVDCLWDLRLPCCNRLHEINQGHFNHRQTYNSPPKAFLKTCFYQKDITTNSRRFILGPWTTSFPITFLAEIGWEFLETFAVFKLFFQVDCLWDLRLPCCDRLHEINQSPFNKRWTNNSLPKAFLKKCLHQKDITKKLSGCILAKKRMGWLFHCHTLQPYISLQEYPFWELFP